VYKIVEGGARLLAEQNMLSVIACNIYYQQYVQLCSNSAAFYGTFPVRVDVYMAVEKKCFGPAQRIVKN
jgi:hypothetical protein